MKSLYITAALIFTAAGLANAQQTPAPAAPTVQFKLSTTAFPDGTIIPIKYTQSAPGAAPGEGTSPAFTWTSVPAGTKSFVLHFHDLDVTKNKTTDDQVHWLVWNIPGTATGLTEAQPRGAQLPNGASQISNTGLVYRGPGAAADGPLHHYIFELYALDIDNVSVQASTDELDTRKKVMQAIQGHVLGKAAYGGLFRRPAVK